MNSSMDWDGVLKRVKAGETDEMDAKFLEILRKALDKLTKVYPGNYYAELARLLRMHKQMSQWEPLAVDESC